MWVSFFGLNVMWMTSGGAGLTRPQPLYYEQPENLNLRNEEELEAERYFNIVKAEGSLIICINMYLCVLKSHS